MTPQETLQKAIDTVVARGACYGESEASLNEIAAYWRAYLRVSDLSPRDVAMMMLLLKLARVKASPDHRDNYIDMAGYAALAGGLVRGEAT